MTTFTESTTLTRDHVLDLMTLMTGDEKHSPAATSTLDVLLVLYRDVFRINPQAPADPHRDRFYLSKGHGPMAYYAVLAATGFFPAAWLSDWATFDSPLGYHPDRNLIPGVEISSGSLGHGLPLALGTALALRAQDNDARVLVLVGDAELDEGSNAEAIEVASVLNVKALSVIAIDNSSASYGVPGRIQARFAANGWRTIPVDGHNQQALRTALQARPADARPTAVIASTEPK